MGVISRIRKEKFNSVLTEALLNEVAGVLEGVNDNVKLRNLRPIPRLKMPSFYLSARLYAENNEEVPREYNEFLQRRKGNEGRVIRQQMSALWATAIKGGYENLGELRRSSRQQILDHWPSAIPGEYPRLGTIRAEALYLLTH